MSGVLDRPKVGIGVFIRREGRILLGQRRESHGPGGWCHPGGHLEYGESFVDCALREVAEECGVVITEPRLAFVTNDVFEVEGKHYITLHMIADWVSGEAELLEPQKCLEWGWFSLDDLPDPMFLSARNALDGGFLPLV